MSGEGKYTRYAAEASDKNTLLNKLFKGEGDKKPIVQDLVGKENEAREAVVAIAREHLQPTKTDSVPGVFPDGVYLDFSGTNAEVTLADTAEGKDVTWKVAGDPANSYIPDISSPGPGKTLGVDKDTDPQVTAVDIKPTLVPGAPGTGTQSPTATIAKIVAANLLGVKGVKGKSGA